MSDTRSVNKTKEMRVATRRRLVLAARIQLSNGGGLTQRMIGDISAQVGIHPHAFRTLFRSDDDFFNAINESLVAECAERLSRSIDLFAPTQIGRGALVEAAYTLASSRPLTRSGMLIRANRRTRGLADNGFGRQIAQAEREFVGALLEIFADLMTKLDREFSLTPKLAIRVILDTYERSFESWMLDGHDEGDFDTSPYVERTLPVLLGHLSAPRRG